MNSAATLIMTILLAAIGGAVVFRHVVVPAFIFFKRYYETGNKMQAENEALDAMGENKGSHVLKDQIKKNKVTGVKEVDDIQESVADTAGGIVGKGGAGEGVGEIAGGLGDALRT